MTSVASAVVMIAVRSAAIGVPGAVTAPRARPIVPISGSCGGSYPRQRRTLNAVHSIGIASSAASAYPGRLRSKPSVVIPADQTAAYEPGAICPHRSTPRKTRPAAAGPSGEIGAKSRMAYAAPPSSSNNTADTVSTLPRRPVRGRSGPG